MECLRKAEVSGRRGCLGEEAGQTTRMQRGCFRTRSRGSATRPEGLEVVLEEAGRLMVSEQRKNRTEALCWKTCRWCARWIGMPEAGGRVWEW